MTQSLRLARHQAAKEGPGGGAAALVARIEAEIATKGRGTGAAELIAKFGVDPIALGQVAVAPATLRASAPTPAANNVIPTPTPAQPQQATAKPTIDAAVAKARADASTRFVTVMASPASAGRQRVCSILLGHARNFSAAEIVKQLPHMPTDRDLAAQDVAKKVAAADAVWDRINAQASARLGLPAREVRSAPTPSQAAADAVWDKANGLARQESAKVQPAATAKSAASASDDVWARVYGSAVQ